MESGIYIIKNKVNKKYYIGSSKDINGRWRKHLSDLRRGIHANQHLQSAWSLYGEENFTFSILEHTSNIAKREQHFINFYEATNREKGYNISLTTTCPMEGRKHADASIEKMRKAKLGKKNNFYGKKHTEEAKQKLRETKVGVPLSKEHKEKILKTAFKSGEANVNAKLTKEIVLALREEYASLENKRGFKARKARELKVAQSTITRALEGGSWSN